MLAWWSKSRGTHSFSIGEYEMLLLTSTIDIKSCHRPARLEKSSTLGNSPDSPPPSLEMDFLLSPSFYLDIRLLILLIHDLDISPICVMIKEHSQPLRHHFLLKMESRHLELGCSVQVPLVFHPMDNHKCKLSTISLQTCNVYISICLY